MIQFNRCCTKYTDLFSLRYEILVLVHSSFSSHHRKHPQREIVIGLNLVNKIIVIKADTGAINPIGATLAGTNHHTNFSCTR